MSSLMFLWCSVYFILVNAVEPWQIRYQQDQRQLRAKPEQISNVNVPEQLLYEQRLPHPRQQDSGAYNWIVMSPQVPQETKEVSQIEVPKPMSRENVMRAEPSPNSIAPSNSADLAPRQHMMTAPEMVEPAVHSVIGEANNRQDFSSSVNRQPFEVQPQVADLQPTAYYEQNRGNPQNSPIIAEQPEPPVAGSSSTLMDSKNTHVVPVKMEENEQVAQRWDSGPYGRPPPAQEYVLPPLYENAFAYQQPTFIQPPSIPVAPVVAPKPDVASQAVSPNPYQASNVMSQSMGTVKPPQPITYQPPALSYMNVHQAPVVPQTQVQQERMMSIPNDEYTRTDSLANDAGSKYCGDYSPDTRTQVLFKDPNSNIHFLTCIGKNQIRRMVCPRYTVFNDYSKRCVQRHHANDKCGPCENGGRCVQDPVTGLFRCECSVNFRGDSCEIFEDPCKRNPCGSKGLCFNISSARGYLCQCADHVFNDNCDENIENNCHRLGSKRFYAERGNLFVHCSDDGLAFVKKCPVGMVFNDAKETCTFPPAYTREAMVHPPGSFRADNPIYSVERQYQQGTDAELAAGVPRSRPRRNAFWAW